MKTRTNSIIARIQSFAPKESKKERESLMENLAMLINSGMDISSALQAAKAQFRSMHMQNLIKKLENEIDNGSSFSQAVEKAHLLPSHYTILLKIGEESGRLNQNLLLIVVQQEKERTFQAKVYSAMLYPVFVLTLTCVIGIGVAWFILPRLAEVFGSLRLELPLITRLLIGFGVLLGKYGVIIVPLFLISLFAFVYTIFIREKTKHIGQTILFAIPLIRKLIQEIEIARFGFVLGDLLTAGVAVNLALQSLYDVTSFPAYKKLYMHVKEKILEGDSFQKSFASYAHISSLFPVTVQYMVFSGEQSGHLPDTCKKIGEQYEARTDNTMKNLTVILEPLLLFIVWIGVVAVAIAVILPIYSLLGGLN